LESWLQGPTERGNGLADGSDIREELNRREIGKGGSGKTHVTLSQQGLQKEGNKDIFYRLTHS